MWLFEYLQLAHQFLGKGRSESEFVPQFFTDVMTAEAPVEDNPFLNITPDYVNRIFAGTSNIDGNKVTALQPHLSGERFQALIDSVFTSNDAHMHMIDEFEKAGEDINDTKIGFALSDLLSRILLGVSAGTDNPKPPKKRRRQAGGKVTIKGTASKDISVVDGFLNVGSESVELPKGITVTPEIADHELTYTSQLCLAFTDQFGRTITCDNVLDDEDCGQYFIDQRQHYYNADAIRAMLEHFPDGTDEFGLVKDETFTGIQSTWMLAAQQNGYGKLLATLQQAGQIALKKSKVSELFGQSEVTGVCHILVNDDRIWWVKQP